MAEKENKVLKNIRTADKKKKITEIAHNSRERFLEVELNGAGVVVGLSSYSVLKGQPNHVGDFKTIFPALESSKGAIDSANPKIFTVTGVETVPVFKDGMSAILFNKTELDALNTEENFNKLADPDLVETIPITAIADKKITLEREPLDGTFTDIIISENEGFFQIGQLTNFEANESQDEISVDTQTSGGYKSSIGGLKSASIEGIAGIYDASIPTVAILMAAYNNESTVRVRQGAMKVKFAPYTVGIYKVSEFTTSGEVSGNSKLEYKSALKLQSGQIEKKIFN